ncbi:acyl-CoA synthetase [Amycolatopsis sp. NPDC059090]|uniref:acyl-CoA synthetase n=1 Tax=unclassified Amycolatopsis TaxID=2618356 RepID=UPI00366E57E4
MYPGAHADRFPDKPAVVVAGSGESLTYRELEDRSLALARFLHDSGMRRGDHLALLSDNSPQAFEVYWAALRSGLYITAINWHLQPAEAAYIVKNCGASGIVASGGLRELAERLVPEMPERAVRLVFGGRAEGYESYSRALAETPAEPLPEQPRGADMLYSLGTTGRPKGIKPPLPDRQVHEPGDPFVDTFGPLYGFGQDTVYLSPGPTYHAAPLRFSGAVHALGGTVVLMRRFEPEQALAAIERHRVTHSQWVPTMFVRMLKLDQPTRERYDLSSQRVAIHAAAPCPVEVKRRIVDWWGSIVHEYYASTEGSGATFIDSSEWLRKPGSVGRRGVGTPHICADNGAELPVGEVGTVYFERALPPFEYHNDATASAAARHPWHEAWTTTGDIGYLDEDGYLFLTERKEFMIISGGVNIYPREVEDALAMHPQVADVAGFGVPDEEMGESVTAIVQPAAGAATGSELAAELRDFLRERIAHYKVPRVIEFTGRLPRTPAGKLPKLAVRARYLSQH